MTSLFPNGFSVLTADENSIKQGFDGVNAPSFAFHGLRGEDVENQTLFKLVKDGTHFYAFFRCAYQETPKDLSGAYGNKVYKGECVELFIGDKDAYYELDVSPYGVGFWALVTADDSGEPCFLEEFDGFSAKTDFVDGRYDVTLKIPFEKLEKFEALSFNAFRVEKTGDERISQSLFPTGCKFHHVVSAFQKIK